VAQQDQAGHAGLREASLGRRPPSSVGQVSAAIDPPGAAISDFARCCGQTGAAAIATFMSDRLFFALALTGVVLMVALALVWP
jgi:hypothetical protein